MTSTSIVIHGHFYQPPREDPWLEEVETESSAAPFHDWNQRVEQECYRAVVAARIPGPEGRIGRIVNALELMSFNFGPTLLNWLEREAPGTYRAVLEADRASAARLGHGNAIAMPYHHLILPLSTRRDKATEVQWGIADFRRRFGREPEGMWLPETAVDEESLDVLAEAGIKFTILAPHQMSPLPGGGLPGRFRTASGRSIALFSYDGAISHDVAFGPLVRDAEAWYQRLRAAEVGGQPARLAAVATDGETYGHHHKFGEMALARVLLRLRETAGVELENFASFLVKHPPTTEVTLLAPSAWSCAHGVERWRSDCGCRIAPDRTTQQAWRTPLRHAVSWLSAELETIFDREGETLFTSATRVREGFGAVAGADPAAALSYAHNHARAGVGPDGLIRAAELLEMLRGALRTFTSCGWFFDDIGGIETIQILRYAARAIDLAGPARERLEREFSDRLAPAISNDRALGTGKDIYLRHARPQIPPVARIAAGVAAARRVAPESAVMFGYRVAGEGDQLRLTHERTGREYRVDTRVERRGLNLSVTVQLPGAEPEHLGLMDLPERHRAAVTNSLRADAIERWFTPAQRARLAHGEATLRDAAHRALLEAVVALESDLSAGALARVVGLADLFERIAGDIPFDVQTRFYQIWQATSQPATLGGVGWALGFTAELQ